jgi:hypothetical protein
MLFLITIKITNSGDDSRGNLMNAIKSAGIGSLKKTQNWEELENKRSSIEERPLNKASHYSAPSTVAPVSFQAEILSKKLSPAKHRNHSHQAPQEAPRPTFESQLFEKIRKRAQIVENQMKTDLKESKSNDFIRSSETHENQFKIPLIKAKGISNHTLNSNPTAFTDEIIRTNSQDIELSKGIDSDNISINSSKRSILGKS